MEGLTNYDKVTRPWGDFERFTLNEKTTVKILTLNPGQEISLQTHEHRDEFWRILSGTGTVHTGGADHPAKAGDCFFSPRLTEHRIEANAEALTFLEIAFGDFDEHDEVRLEDKYNRA